MTELTGWISLYRKILDSWIYKNDKYFKAFAFLIMHAEYAPKKVFKYKALYTLKRGEILLSVGDLSKGTSLSYQEARTFLKLLDKADVIKPVNEQSNTDLTNKVTKLSVVNYETYQMNQQTKQHEDNEQSNNESTNSLLINKGDKKEEKKEKKPKELAFFDRLSFEIPPLFDDELKLSFYEYSEMRKKIKKPMIEGTIERALKRVVKLSGGDKETAIEILRYSTDGSYQGLFEPKKKEEFNDVDPEEYASSKDIFAGK